MCEQVSGRVNGWVGKRVSRAENGGGDRQGNVAPKAINLCVAKPLCAARHACAAQVFVNLRLHVSGGALGGGRMVEDASSVAGEQGLSPNRVCTPASSSTAGLPMEKQ